MVLLLIATLPFSVKGQNLTEKPPLSSDFETNTGLTFYGMSYPMGVNGEVSKNLLINYQTSDRLHLQLQHFYEKFGTLERAKSAILFKYHVNRKLYVFAGPENEYGFDNITGEPELIRVNLNIGVGYKVNPNLLLEMGYHRQLNAQPSEVYITPTKQNTFSLRARF